VFTTLARSLSVLRQFIVGKFQSPFYARIVKGLCACVHSNVHANSPMLCSFRISYIGECTIKDVEDLSSKVPQDIATSISDLTGKTFHSANLTSDIKSLLSECDKDQNVSIKGPSGCGKTYALACFTVCNMCHKKYCVCV